MNGLKLDINYRWLFGMIPNDEMRSIMEENDIDELPPVKGILGGIPSIGIVIPTGEEYVGYGCSLKLEDIYGKYTQYARCAIAHDMVYRELITYLISTIPLYGMNIILIDLANMMRGALATYMDEIMLLPMSYKGSPVMYIIILPQWEVAQPEFIGNKVILPVTCLIPDGVEGTNMIRCYKGVGETDDILLIHIYNYIHSQYPNNVYVLSGDKYKWMGKMNMPENDMTLGHINISYVSLTHRDLGFSPFTLVKTRRSNVNRIEAFGLDDNNELPSAGIKHSRQKTQEFKPSAKAQEFKPSTKAQEFKPSTKAQEFKPSTKAQEFKPSAKAQEFKPSKPYVPLSGAREFKPSKAYVPPTKKRI